MAAVLVHIDLDSDQPHPASLAALAAGRLVASSWGAALYAAVVLHDGREHASPDSTAHLMHGELAGFATARAMLAEAGADKIVVALSDVPAIPLWSAQGTAWQTVLDHLRPRLVLFGTDAPSAAELGPRTGARIGARLLLRARPILGDTVELRDRDGGYARASDGGAAVVLIGSAPRAAAGPSVPAHGHDPIELVVLAVPSGGDARVELIGAAPADVVHTSGTIIALGDDVVGDAQVMADATRLAAGLGGMLVGGREAARAGAAALERGTALAPELCVQIGASRLDLAGATCVIRIGPEMESAGGRRRLGGEKRAETLPNESMSSKATDGVLAGAPATALAELVQRLELS